jgi:exopolyphosphatase / guanosine-5'-triphosphate,3'-diphosphate pyrophosphatase
VAAPVQLSAIDGGSNAIRLVIARATSPQHIQIIENERAAVRLGHNAFTHRILDDETIARATRAFRHFRDQMDHHHVTAYRAVATSAAREVRNGRQLMERIRRKSGIELEIISSQEEARLVCAAVHWALGDQVHPRLIFDLGGGSLELNFFERGELRQRVALPLGTIRLMETFSIEGAIDEDSARRLRHHVLSLLRSAMPNPPRLARAIAVACGGNAEALVRLAPGASVSRIPAINTRLLEDQMWRIVRLDVASRMRVFRVRQDRAEVMGIAAIIINTVARWLRLRSLLVPGVGVREGLLLDLVAEQYSCRAGSDEDKVRAAKLLAGVRWFARRHHNDSQHADQVAQLALTLFDQLRPLHELGAEARLALEMGALLHDVGHFVSRKAHHRHGEYLVRWGEIPGLRGWRREMVAALVRYHNCKSEPQVGHASYAALDGEKRRQLRLLTSLLRISEKLESEHAQKISGVDVQISGHRAIFLIQAAEGTRLDIAGLERKSGLFEKEFHLRAEFRRAQRREQVA